MAGCLKPVLIPLRIRSISTGKGVGTDSGNGPGLNPFENQVYFYLAADNYYRSRTGMCLNPFENQVYFYFRQRCPFARALPEVLIPLRIRSISTPE